MSMVSSTLKQVSCHVIVFFLSLLQGLKNGWLASATAVHLDIPTSIFADERNLTWIATSEHVGQILFVVLFSFFVTKSGRKKILLTSNIILIIGWWFLYMSHSLEFIIISQFILSMGLGLFDVIACTYIGELSSPRNRAILSTIALLLTSVGTEIQFALQIFYDYRLLSLVPLIIGIVSLIISPFTILESPYHLIMNGGQDEAMKILSSLYVNENSTHVMMLYEDLQRYADTENNDEMNYSQFFAAISDMKTFAFICSIYSITYITVQYTFLTFGPILMEPYSNELSVDLVMNIMGGVTVVCAIVAPLLVDIASRNLLLASGFGSVALLQCALAILFYVESFGSEKITIVPTIIVTLVVLLVILHNLTIVPVVQILRAEVFPHAMKMRGNCIMVVLKEAASILSRGLFLPIAITAGFGFTFLLYAIVAFMAYRYVHFFYKETKNKTLAEIREQYRT